MSCNILKTIDEMLSNATLTDKQRAVIEAQKAKILASRAVVFTGQQSNNQQKLEEKSNFAKVEVVKGLTYKTPDTSTSINTLRKYSGMHYGNPFGTNAYGANAEIPNQGNDAEVTDKYIAWLKGTDFTDKLQQRREWIVNNIRNGVLDGKVLMYFRDSPVNHAKALAELVNDKSWLDNKIPAAVPEVVGITPEFNKLPNYTPGQKTMTYAGIGSRETPKEVLELMTKASTWLESKGYKLQTGKTFGGREEGADKAFSDGTKNKELFGPEFANDVTKKIAKEIHPAPQHLKEGGLKLMARNTNQVFGKNLDTPVDFVLFYAKETNNPLRPKGGTGQAVEMARRKGIPTINMSDKDWREQLKEAVSRKAVKQPTAWVKDEVSSVKKDIENTEISAADIDISRKTEVLLDSILNMNDGNVVFDENIIINNNISTPSKATSEEEQSSNTPLIGPAKYRTAALVEVDSKLFYSAVTITPEDIAEINSKESFSIAGVGETNVGQTQAVKDIVKWFTKGRFANKGSYLLKGSGGTGKTTVVKSVLSELGLKPADVIFVTPTRKAMGVIGNSNRDTVYKGSDYNTVAQLIAKTKASHTGTFGTPEDYADVIKKAEKYQGKLLVIDESSMISMQDYNDLFNLYGAQNILFMGDEKQMPPIINEKGEITKTKKWIDDLWKLLESPVFNNHNDEGINVSTLTEVKRQSADSPINKITDMIGNLVTEYIKERKAKEKVVTKDGLTKMLKDKLVQIGKTNGDPRLVVTGDEATTLRTLVEKLKEDKFNAAYIHYNNVTNGATVALSNKIRRMLFGKQLKPNSYVEGDLIIFTESTRVTTVNGIEEFVSVSTGTDGKTTEVGINHATAADTVTVDTSDTGVIKRVIPLKEYLEKQGIDIHKTSIKGFYHSLTGELNDVAIYDYSLSRPQAPETRRGNFVKVIESLAIMEVELNDGHPENSGKNRIGYVLTSMDLPNIKYNNPYAWVFGKKRSWATTEKDLIAESTHAASTIIGLQREELEDYFRKGGKQDKKLYDDIDKVTMVVANMKHAYVINSHQVQGSSYKHVVVGVDNILRSAWDANQQETMLKALYVAVSRPRENLTLLMSGGKLPTGIAPSNELEGDLRIINEAVDNQEVTDTDINNSIGIDWRDYMSSYEQYLSSPGVAAKSNNQSNC